MRNGEKKRQGPTEKRVFISDWLLAKLSRETSSGRFIPTIDGLRFVAILAVVLFHAHGHYFRPDPAVSLGGWDMLSYFISKGWFGVQLFFIISGFILAAPFAEHHLHGGPAISLKRYYLRRLTRLEPPYILALCFGLWSLVNESGQRLEPLWPHFFASLGYLHNLIYGQRSVINEVAWTLEVEVQFYMLAPLLCSVFAIKRPAVRRALVGGAIVAASMQDHFFYSFYWSMTLLGQIRYFLLGFLLADLYLTDWRTAPARRWAWDAVGVAAWLAIPYCLARPWLIHFAIPVALLLAYIGAFRGRLLHWAFTRAWIVAVGGMCYTIYLYHTTLTWRVERLVARLTGPIEPGNLPLGLLQMGLMAAGVIAIAATLFVLTEKPFMRRDWPAQAYRGLRTLARKVAAAAGVVLRRPGQAAEPAPEPVEARREEP